MFGSDFLHCGLDCVTIQDGIDNCMNCLRSQNLTGVYHLPCGRVVG